MSIGKHSLRLKRLGIDTYKEAIIYIREKSHICRSEGFEAPARVQVKLRNRVLIAMVNVINSDLLLPGEAGLSNYAWDFLHASEGDVIVVSHPPLLRSLKSVRAKVCGHELKKEEINNIIDDVTEGRYSDIHIATFLAGCAGGRLTEKEIVDLTDAMVHAGNRLTWPSDIVVDKHCVGGLSGNRTSMLVVPIVTAFGLVMPKTSSRAITSPAGTADTMEVLAPVNLSLDQMRKVVELENGCIAWGGAMRLSPADDILIQVERVIDLDSEGQMVASILSKKIAAGSTHVLIDIPIGHTAKVRSETMATDLKNYLMNTGKNLGIHIQVYFSDGSQPVGRGIGPALEAKDVLSVLQNEKNAPLDLRDRALVLAGQLLEFSNKVVPGTGKKIATEILDSGQAWKKFQAICHAQGGLFEPPTAAFQHIVCAPRQGVVTAINNRRMSQLAKLAGAPRSKAAGIELLTPVGTTVEKGQPLFIIHSDAGGELKYALSFLEQEKEIVLVS